MEPIQSQSIKRPKHCSEMASLAQLECILEFFEKHRDMATGIGKRDAFAIMKRHELWNQLVSRLNGMEGGKKTVRQWQKFWHDKKYLARKAAREKLTMPADRSSSSNFIGKQNVEDYNARILAILKPSESCLTDNQGIKNTSIHIERLEGSREKEFRGTLEKSNDGKEIINIEDVECRDEEGVEIEFLGFLNVDDPPEIETLDMDLLERDSEQPSVNTLNQKEDEIPKIKGFLNVDDPPEIETLDMDLLEHDSEQPSVNTLNQKEDETPKAKGFLNVDDPPEIETLDMDLLERDSEQPSVNTLNQKEDEIPKGRNRRRGKQALKRVSSVHERVFGFEERRAENDRRRNEELAGIRTAVVDLCRLVRQLIECHYE